MDDRQQAGQGLQQSSLRCQNGLGVLSVIGEIDSFFDLLVIRETITKYLSLG